MGRLCLIEGGQLVVAVDEFLGGEPSVCAHHVRVVPRDLSDLVAEPGLRVIVLALQGVQFEGRKGLFFVQDRVVFALSVFVELEVETLQDLGLDSLLGLVLVGRRPVVGFVDRFHHEVVVEGAFSLFEGVLKVERRICWFVGGGAVVQFTNVGQLFQFKHRDSLALIYF